MTPHYEFWDAVQRIRERDGRYRREAYAFVMESLDATIRAIGERRHVTAAELVEGMLRYANARFGMLANTVLETWGIASGSDVGDIVFQLIEEGVLSRRDEDAREDFELSVDFKRVLEDDYFDAGSGV